MRFPTASLLPLLALLTTTTAFSCNSTFPLTMCCGAYIPYETGSATDLTIFCGPAPLNSTIDMATNITSTEAYCPAAASVSDQRYPGCCQTYESREEMAFNCLPQ